MRPDQPRATRIGRVAAHFPTRAQAAAMGIWLTVVEPIAVVPEGRENCHSRLGHTPPRFGVRSAGRPGSFSISC